MANREVPLDDDASGPFLPWIVAVMVYLAALALAAALLIHQVTADWQKDLAGGLTVQVPPLGPEERPEAHAAQLDRLLELLNEEDGVETAKLLDRAEISALLEPWLGDIAAEHDLPVPNLVAVELKPGASPDLKDLQARLEAVSPGALIDDHQRWVGDLLALGRSVKLGAVVVLLLIILCAVVAVVFLTRTGLAIHGQVIGLLHLIGAQDSYVAKQFQLHALRLGLRGGLVGLALAAATILAAGAWLRATQNEVLPDIALSLGGWAALLLLPAVTALVAMITARITVLRSLARMP